MQVKPYKPQNNNSITKTSDREKKNYTLDVYNEAAGIKPKKNVLEPYSNLVPNAQTTLNEPAQTNSSGTVQPFKAPKTTVNSVPSTMPGTPAYKVDTNDMMIQEQVAKDSQDAGWTVPNLNAPKNKPSLSGGPTFGSDSSRLASPSAVGTTAANPKASETPASPGSGTLADYTPAFKAATARPQAVEPAGFSSYMDMVNNTRKMQGLAPVPGGTQTMSAETGGTKPNVLDPYIEVDNELKSWEDVVEDLYPDIDDTYAGSADIQRKQTEAALAEAERQRNIDLQNAFINSEMTKKYLPIYLKQAGMGGLGVSQSTLAQVANDYDNLVSGINSETNAAKRDLFQGYNDAIAELKLQRDQEMALERTNSYEDLFAGLESKTISDPTGKSYLTEQDYNELLADLENKKKILKPSDYNDLKERLQSVAKLGGAVKTIYARPKEITPWEAVLNGFSDLKNIDTTDYVDGDIKQDANGKSYLVYNGYFWPLLG